MDKTGKVIKIMSFCMLLFGLILSFVFSYNQIEEIMYTVTTEQKIIKEIIETTYKINLIHLFIGIFISLFVFFVLYSFGQLIESANKIKEKYCGIEKVKTYIECPKCKYRNKIIIQDNSKDVITCISCNAKLYVPEKTKAIEIVNRKCPNCNNRNKIIIQDDNSKGVIRCHFCNEKLYVNKKTEEQKEN